MRRRRRSAYVRESLKKIKKKKKKKLSRGGGQDERGKGPVRERLDGGLSWSTPPPFSATVAFFYLNAVRTVGASQNHPQREVEHIRRPADVASHVVFIPPSLFNACHYISLVGCCYSCSPTITSRPSSSPTSSQPFWDLTNRQKLPILRKKQNNYKDHLIQRCRYWNLSLIPPKQNIFIIPIPVKKQTNQKLLKIRKAKKKKKKKKKN